ncbi:DUF2339 domain-containing protein [Granulicella arctica]|uniref:Putative membrane protein n=1 Tax=Granulicella arctica TaxID=940613 RepID=A0A7Y9PDC5_9BACT|nr:DUF2339 domain-containing protein [Granulicella arctica]NYF77842.1 putative membrane protein [Granulicella arctica]
MEFDRNNIHPRVAAELDELRLRVDRLEHELADLLQRRAVAGLSAVLPPPLIATVTKEEVAVAMPAVEVSAVPTFAAAAPPPPKASLENRIGSQLLNRIGVVALLIGTAWFLQLAIDNNWIGAAGRILIGLVAGAGIIVWSERFRRHGSTAFSYSLKAVGSGVLYLSLWAAFQLYHLMPASAALGAMLLVTAWNAFMAWSQDAELLAAYALVGGFLTPLLLSTGGNHEIFLFSYILAIDLATVVLIRLKPWPRLLIGVFPATIVYFIGWYLSFYVVAELGVTSIFLVLFWLTFISVSLGSMDGAPSTMRDLLGGIFLPLGNAAFVSLGLYFVLQDSGHHAALPWLMLLLAAAYLGLMRLPQSRVASAIHLSLAIVLLTIAIPLKASGHWITVTWLVEGVALFWVSERLGVAESEGEGKVSLRPETVLRWLSGAALTLGFVALFAVSYWFDAVVQIGFFNHDLATALIGVAAFSIVGWLAFQGHGRRTSLEVVALAMGAVGVIGALLSLREITLLYSDRVPHRAFLNADFATALVGIAVLGACAHVAIRISRTAKDAPIWPRLAGAAIIALNLVAVLSCVQEIHSLWASSASAGLKEALAISAFLMVYSAVLLVVGFWKRTAFIRWQGLALLVFTIGKTFLYDMRSLSQGYRVVSFMGLGVLLMAVSFAYQKDWLGLREPVEEKR